MPPGLPRDEAAAMTVFSRCASGILPCVLSGSPDSGKSVNGYTQLREEFWWQSRCRLVVKQRVVFHAYAVTARCAVLII
jgi:hypothetical protein